MPPKFNLNGKTLTAPLAAFCMAMILFVYARTSIQAAKRNATLHRQADGGQISWGNENLRRHGKLESPATEKTVVGEIVGTLRAKTEDKPKGSSGSGGISETENERKLREYKSKGTGA